MFKTKLIASNYFSSFNIHLNFVLITILCFFTKAALTQLASQSELTEAFNGEQNNIQNSNSFKIIPAMKRSMALGRLEFRPGKRFSAIDLGETELTNETIENWFRPSKRWPNSVLTLSDIENVLPAFSLLTEAQMGKRSMTAGRSGFRPGKRSIAIGREKYRPGKKNIILPFLY